MINRYIGWRRRRWTSERPVDTGTLLHHQAAPDRTSAIDDRDEMRDLLSVLPPRSKAVLVMRYYLDMEDSAIAEALGISASGVRATASRALAALRSSIATRTERASS
jgi:RNA polymerase sigma factor (sigma-70 family)